MEKLSVQNMKPWNCYAKETQIRELKDDTQAYKKIVLHSPTCLKDCSECLKGYQRDPVTYIYKVLRNYFNLSIMTPFCSHMKTTTGMTAVCCMRKQAVPIYQGRAGYVQIAKKCAI